MIEKELKALLDEFTYYQALSLFDWDSKTIQTNYYYTDREGILERLKITVRVREKNGTYLLQVKTPISECSALHIKDEYEKVIDNSPSHIDRKLIESIIGIKVNSVTQIGELVTERHIITYNNKIEICLDKNYYLKITDYEMEIEFYDVIDQKLLDELSSIGIHFDTKINGKFSRFMTQYNMQKDR